MAWLDTAPKDAKKTRRESLGEGSVLLEMPTIDYGEWLIDVLLEIGPAELKGDYAMSPIAQSEITAYAINYGVEFTPWDVAVLRRMSREYIHSHYAAKDAHCAAPFSPAIESTPDSRAKVDGFFRGLASRKVKRGKR